MKKLSRKWLKTYYPKPAFEVRDKSDLKVVKHSLLKWIGLTDLERFDLILKNGEVIEKNPDMNGDEEETILEIDADSCSLCVKHYNNSCNNCPLYEMRNGSSCDDGDNPYEGDNLYENSLKNPQLMVDVLTKLLTWVREKQSGKSH